MTMRERSEMPATMGTVGDWAELLVPFDGSRGAEKVLRRACRAARRDDAGLAVYVVAADEEAWIAKETARCVRATTS